jgi:hypothetical protein
MKDKITSKKIEKYLSITKKALEMAKSSECRQEFRKQRQDFLQMIEAYLSDSQHFLEKEDLVNSFAAVNYAHGWLDAGARLGIFQVRDSSLFTVDD